MPSFRLSFFFLLLLHCFHSVAHGTTLYTPSDSELEWHNIDVDGHRAAVFCVFHDSRSLVWMGTSQGLFLYDGAESHRIGGEEHSGIQVYAIVEHEGDLYLGTNHGLMIFHSEEGRLDLSPTAISEEIRCMLADNGKLLMGTLNGLFTYDFSTKKQANIGQSLPHQSVYCLLRDSRGILYAGTYSGLARYDVSASQFHAVGMSALSGSSQQSFINCMLESPDRQAIYVGTSEGLFKYVPAQEKWNSVSGTERMMVKSLAYDRDGHLLVGTYDGLCCLTTEGTQLFRRDLRNPTSPAGNQIWAVVVDAANNMWIGHERGFSIASNSSYYQEIKISSLIPTGESNEFLTIYRDSRGTLWLGGTNGVIVQKKDGTTQWHHLATTNEASADVCVRSIMEDSHGTMWLSTDGGIFRYDAVTGHFRVYHLTDTRAERVSSWVYAIRQMGDDLWVASYLGGINRVSLSKLPADGAFVKADFSLERGQVMPNDNISQMLSDSEGRLWILLYGDSCLYRYDTTNDHTDRFNIQQMAGASPTHICIDKKGRTWCAYKGGAIVFDSNEKPTTITLPPSGSDESVLAMAPVDEGVWLSTLNNLWSIDGLSLTPSLIPIPQKGFSAIWDDPATDKVILGGLDEMVKVSKVPIGETQDLGLVKMVLQCADGQVKSLRNLANLPEGLSIPYGGRLSLLVSTLSYSPDIVPHLQYRVIKKGSNEKGGWVVMPERASTINLSDMSFGDYEIQMKTVSNPQPPLSVPLRVGKPFWLSWWAIALYLLFIATIVGLLIWYLHRRSIRRAQEREREEALANVETKLAFLSDEKHDLEARIEQLLKSHEEINSQLRLQALTDAKPIEAESPLEKQLACIAQAVEENVSSLDLNGAFISERCSISEKQLYRLMKKHLGITPSEYIRNVRMKKAAMLLSQNYFTISEVAYMVGFSAPSYFSKCFQDYYGVAPSAYHADDNSATSNSE